jgi:hypothetical protein
MTGTRSRNVKRVSQLSQRLDWETILRLAGRTEPVGERANALAQRLSTTSIKKLANKGAAKITLKTMMNWVLKIKSFSIIQHNDRAGRRG